MRRLAGADKQATDSPRGAYSGFPDEENNLLLWQRRHSTPATAGRRAAAHSSTAEPGYSQPPRLHRKRLRQPLLRRAHLAPASAVLVGLECSRPPLALLFYRDPDSYQRRIVHEAGGTSTWRHDVSRQRRSSATRILDPAGCPVPEQ